MLFKKKSFHIKHLFFLRSNYISWKRYSHFKILKKNVITQNGYQRIHFTISISRACWNIESVYVCCYTYPCVSLFMVQSAKENRTFFKKIGDQIKTTDAEIDKLLTNILLKDLKFSVVSSFATHLTSVSMIFSIYSTVRNWGWPVTGHGTSSVRRTIFSSRIFSRSRITMGPSLDLIAIFGKTITSLVLKFQEKNNTNKILNR